MKISWLPRYDRNAASSRLRVYALHEAMSGLCESGIGYCGAADVLMVQKAVDPQVFRIASGFRGRVVYDFDDLLDASVLRMAQEVAELFTTDTEGRRSAVAKRCELIPDPIDYEPAAPWEASTGTGAAWFGNYPNFESARWMAETLTGAGIPVRAISDLTAERAKLPIELVPWNYAGFPRDLRRSGVAILSHGGADQDKSNNKMTAAITFGVPCIVSNSLAYEQLARACGLDWTVVSNRGELLEAFRRLQNAAERHQYLSAAQPVIWDTYNARSVARRLVALLEE
jgi:hypothetical protein